MLRETKSLTILGIQNKVFILFLKTQRSLLSLLVATASGALLASGPVTAQVGDHSLCHSPNALKAEPLTPIAGGELMLQAREGEARDQHYRFLGDVLVRFEQKMLRADEANYDDQRQQLQAQGRVHFQIPGLIASGDAATLELASHKGSVQQAQYQLSEQGGRGRAEEIRVHGESVDLQGATYTTCPGDKPSWQLSATSINLDRDANEGVARHVTLELAEVPVFYWPYVSFALEGRKSGFLAPSLGYSETNGSDITLPYYLNIAPNRDATLFPRTISERGAQLGAEFRYLNASNGGVAYGEHIVDDQLFGADRSLFSWHHAGEIDDNWTYGSRLEHVSDRQYFADLGTNLAATNQTQLERSAQMRVGAQQWSFEALVQDYQTLGSGQEPHRRLPQLHYQHRWKQAWLQSELRAQYTFFQHEELANGQRLIVEPVFTSGYDSQAGYAKPRLRLRHSQYILEGDGSDNDRNPSVNTPVFSVDSGLRFIRFASTYEQTLEPRLFYTHTPYQQQNSLPNFDTGALDFSFSQLFRDYRYNGGDRVGDEERLTLGLSSRFIDSIDGRERLRLSLAHATYLQDQRVRLASENKIEQGDERVAAEVASEFLPNWQVNSSIFHDPSAKRPDKAAIRVNYETNQHGIDVGARYRKDLLKQIGGSAYTSLNGQWRVAAKWLYSLQQERTAEVMLGAEYVSCCWRLRIIAQEYITDELHTDRNVGVEIELNGLASVGQKTQPRLSREVMGYRPEGN
jgi:LPS-assembly protein